MTLTLTRSEKIFGGVYLLLQTLLVPFAVTALCMALGNPSDALINLICFFCNAPLALVFFRRLLVRSWRNAARDRKRTLAVTAKGFGLYWAINLLITAAILALRPDFANANDAGVNAMIDEYPVLMTVAVIFAAPLAEECLFRGWIFTGLAQKSVPLAYGPSLPSWLISQLSRKPKLLKSGDESYCVEQIHSSSRDYIFGCGHVSRELEPILSHVGFRCIMMDDRPEFAQRELFPTAEEVKLVDFSAIDKSVSICSEDYVCVMTRGHAYDTEIQAQILKYRPAYVGVIGSRKKAAGVRQVLKEQHGLSDEELNLITTPIGLEIEAETPAEIAISIAAQLIQTRAKLNQM